MTEVSMTDSSSPSTNDRGQLASSSTQLLVLDALVPIVTLPLGIGMLPITLSIAQVCSWMGLKKTKVQDLINGGGILTAKVDGRTLVLTGSVIALIERSRISKGS
jgi:hypothetical protein